VQQRAELPVAFTVSAPTGSRFRFKIDEDGTRLAPPVISPDGHHVVYGVIDAGGERSIYRRSMNDTESRLVPGMRDARSPFWSPDSQMLGFFLDGKLRTAPLSGGSSVALADGASNPRGAGSSTLPGA
jgi:hypothetical protein